MSYTAWCVCYISPELSAQQRLDKAEGEMSELAERMKPYNATYSRLQSEIAKAKTQLQYEAKQPRVSDHAVIRYLERKYGFTFENVRESILTPNVIAAMDLKCGSVKQDGMILKIKDKCVTTIVNK